MASPLYDFPVIFHYKLAFRCSIKNVSIQCMCDIQIALGKSVVHCETYHAVLFQFIVHEGEMDKKISMLGACYVFNLKSAVHCYHHEYSLTYPTLISDADISSFLHKAFHCVVTAIVSCNMQGSALIER